MTYNKIPVAFGALRKITAPSINYQYDAVQYLVINGLELPEFYEVDFCNEGDAQTITMTGTADGVQIPDEFLLTGKRIKAYIVVTGEDEGAVQTRYEVTIPVNARPQRTDIQPTPAEQQQIDALIDAMNDVVEDAQEVAQMLENVTAEAETLPAEEEATASYADGVFSFGIPAGPAGADGQDGQPGSPGTDGVSPTVTITDIDGGHRITITDATGPHTFDVMDGEGGSDVTDVQINGTSILDEDGVASIPMATTSQVGLVKPNNSYGLQVYGSGASRTIGVLLVSDDNIKRGLAVYSVTPPSKQHAATFYGLAKAAGDTTQSASSNAVGTYTEEAKTAIRNMLGISGGELIVVTVTGTTPVITAEADHQYKCGEVATLDFTPCASGICDVIFTSGTTATILTAPSTIKWPEGFDPDNLDTETIYELNVVDGVLGGVLKW